MENKAIVMSFLLITTMISSTYPSLAIENEDKPLLDPDTTLEEAFARSPGSREYNINALNSVPAPEANYFMNCAMTRTRDVKCGDEIMLDLLKNKPMSRECCLVILHNGEGCNMLFAKITSRLYQLRRFPSVSKSLLLRTKKIWNRCSAAVTETPTPLSG